jgi:hypothetical protein
MRDVKDRWKNVHHFLSAKSGTGCHYILIISFRGTNIIGQFFLFRHVAPRIHWIIELKFHCHTIAAYTEKVQPMIQNFKISL